MGQSSDQPPQPPHRTGMSLGVGVVGVLAGLMFATNASLFADSPGRQPMNLEELVRSESERLEETNTEVRDLQSQVDDLVDAQSRANPEVAASPELSFAAGRTGAEGEGVVVSLWDSPLIHDIPDGFRADDLLVHEQDLWGVLNALWTGGADAVSVQGHRVGPLTDIRCVGNVLLLDGYTYSPPYTLAAIGEPAELRAALSASEAVSAYRTYVDAVSLGWSLEEQDSIAMPAIEGGLSMQYARLPGDEPITLDSPPDGES